MAKYIPDSQTVFAEITSGDSLTTVQAATTVSVSTICIWKWINVGVTATDGTKVYLEAARIGCRWRTSKAALERFMEALTPPTNAVRNRGRVPKLTKQRLAERAAAEEEARRRGVL